MLVEHHEEAWNMTFREYANTAGITPEEKTQAFCRARLIADAAEEQPKHLTSPPDAESRGA